SSKRATKATVRKGRALKKDDADCPVLWPASASLNQSTLGCRCSRCRPKGEGGRCGKKRVRRSCGTNNGNVKQ
ncbi:unnamed protein product, partial [Ectocarpus sp. 8 AP-2014]